MRFNENTFFDDNNNFILKSFHSSVEAEKRTFTEHHHTECELSVFLEGSGIYSIHGREYEFHAGDIFLFGSNEAHCITEICEKINLLNIQFEPRFLWENSENTELLNIFAARNKNFSNKFSDDTHLFKLITDIEKEISQKLPCYKINIKCLLLSALTHIVRNYDYIDQNKIINSHSPTTGSLKKAINYIDSHFTEKITLEGISKSACMSETHFCATFKKYNGISPWEYITIKRVEKAKQLLKTSNINKLEIAEICGFSSSSNFYKMFSKITGKKPSDYVK